MKRLWAPWRIEYIKSDKQQDGCVFCIKPKENNDRDSLIVYRGNTSFVIMNYYPYNNGHLLVVPYRHLANFHDLTADEKIEIMNLLDKAMVILKADMAPQGFNMGANLGSIAGAGIDGHIHFHVVPRWNGDTNFMPVCGQTKIISEALRETGERLRTQYDWEIK